MALLIHLIKRLVRLSVTAPYILVLALLNFSSTPLRAQYFDMEPGVRHTTIPFRLIRDMVIIKLNINNKGPFNFILDTGVGLMLITDPKLVDSIHVVNKRTIKIAGLGEGDDYEAYVTPALQVDIHGLVSYDVGAAILKTDHFGLSNYAGIPIHGLLGYEFFNNLAVKIDFVDSTLSVSRAKDIRPFRKGNKIHLSVEDRKPYVTAKVTFPNGSKTNEKLILDLGAGHPLSLDDIIKKRGLPDKFIAANLGIGLTGPISGFLSRVKSVELGRFELKNVITSFPVDDNSGKAQFNVERDGNLGMGILKRFTVIIDYPDSALYLKPAQNFDEPFEHDMSGLEYYIGGDDFNRVFISRVEPGSPGDEVGLEKDDEIIAINFKDAAKMKLEEIDAIFKSKEDRSLLVDIMHDGKLDHVILVLKRRI